MRAGYPYSVDGRHQLLLTPSSLCLQYVFKAIDRSRCLPTPGSLSPVLHADEIWDQTESAEFSVNLQSEVNYSPIDSALSDKIRDLAKLHGVSPQTLLNLWVQERLQEEKVG